MTTDAPNDASTKTKKRFSVKTRIDELVQEHGSLRNASKAIRIPAPYLSQIRSGKYIATRKSILKKLDIVPLNLYRRRKPNERI